MIQPDFTAETLQQVKSASTERVYCVTYNDRTAGSIPVWEQAETGKEILEAQLSETESKENFADILAYQDTTVETPSEESFGFLDLIDMVNPLQHIPLVNMAYREITGDQIKPIGKLIGGGVFGGPLGVASGIVDLVITEETGKDMIGNAVAMMEKDAPSSPETINPAVKLASSAYERVQFNDERTAGFIARYA